MIVFYYYLFSVLKNGKGGKRMIKWNCPNIEDRKEDQSIPVAPNNNHVEIFFNNWLGHVDIHK